MYRTVRAEPFICIQLRALAGERRFFAAVPTPLPSPPKRVLVRELCFFFPAIFSRTNRRPRTSYASRFVGAEVCKCIHTCFFFFFNVKKKCLLFVVCVRFKSDVESVLFTKKIFSSHFRNRILNMISLN